MGKVREPRFRTEGLRRLKFLSARGNGQRPSRPIGVSFDTIEIRTEADRVDALLEELMRRGWTDADVAKVAGENVLRVLADAEAVGARLRQTILASEPA